jgi:hypothetical protein
MLQPSGDGLYPLSPSTTGIYSVAALVGALQHTVEVWQGLGNNSVDFFEYVRRDDGSIVPIRMVLLESPLSHPPVRVVSESICA